MKVASFLYNRSNKDALSEFFTNIKNSMMMKIRETIEAMENLPPLNFKLGANFINRRKVMSCDMYVLWLHD